MDTTNLGSLGDLIAYIGLLVTASIGYGKVVGPYQVELTETVIEALGIKTRFKRVANLATGIVVALAFTGVAGYALGRWELLLPGVFAGFLASVEAGRKHDKAKLESVRG